jgi:hypothetical protein
MCVAATASASRELVQCFSLLSGQTPDGNAPEECVGFAAFVHRPGDFLFEPSSQQMDRSRVVLDSSS